MKKLYKISLISLLIMVLMGCSQNRAYKTYPSILTVWNQKTTIQDTIDEGIIDIADQLVKSSRLKINSKIAITSFVNLSNLDKSSYFGRKVSESMFNELHIRGFNLIDIRGTKSIRVNDNGEFFISRNIKLLNNKTVLTPYILVGTYSQFGKGILLNARIVDNTTGDVISTARTIIDINSCDISDNCIKKSKNKASKVKFKVNSRTIGISYENCPSKNRGCSSSSYHNSNIYGDKNIVRERMNIN